jgi:hypothetical protein
MATELWMTILDDAVEKLALALNDTSGTNCSIQNCLYNTLLDLVMGHRFRPNSR